MRFPDGATDRIHQHRRYAATYPDEGCAGIQPRMMRSDARTTAANDLIEAGSW